MTDIIVIGGGTAGLTSALYARRAGKTVTLIEKENTGGKIVFSPRIDNYPGLLSVSGSDYAAALTEQVTAAGADIQYAEAHSIVRDDTGFIVQCDTGEMRGRALIIATGTSHRRLGLEKEAELVGCGVSYCAVCDGAFYAGAETAVLGGGNTALTDALFLSGICKKVTVIHRRDTFRGEDALLSRLKTQPNVSFQLSSIVTELRESNGLLSGITVQNLRTAQEFSLSVDGLFIAIGQTPQTAVCSGFVELDAAGYIVAGEDCATSREGVYAAGDCRTKTVRQLTTAAGDGAAAALAAYHYIEGLT